MSSDKLNNDKHEFLPPWHLTDTDLTIQLKREISRDHILYGKDLKTIARRHDNDDALFQIFNSDFEYAKVHLTWSQKPIKDSYWPATETFKDWQEAYENLIVPDSKDWE